VTSHVNRLILAAAGVAIIIANGSRPASATIVESESTGTELSTTLLSVKFKTAGVKSAVVQGGPAVGQGSVTVGGFFSFTVTGETFRNRWTLRNLTTGDFIESAVFDLTTTSALFDDGSPSDTPNSDVGRKGVSMAIGVAPTKSFEHVPWPNAMNKGDLYLKETLEWGVNTFGPGMFCSWDDDTDDYLKIPEPAAVILAGVGFAAIGQVRRIRRNLRLT
jgi:hypothetical protein